MKEFPENGRAVAFMAFTHMLACMDEEDSTKQVKHLQQGAELAKKAKEMTDEKSTKELAQSILDWEAELQNIEMA